MRILLTGAGGQLGRALPPVLARHELLALDRRALDITRLDAVRQAVHGLRPELLLNAAAYNLVDQAESDPQAAYRGNALGPRNLALAAAEIGVADRHVGAQVAHTVAVRAIGIAGQIVNGPVQGLSRRRTF